MLRDDMFNDEIKITEENAEECERAYQAGIRLRTPPDFEMKSQIYHVAFNIGRQYRLANKRGDKVDLTPVAITVRDCVSGAEAARTRVKRKKPPQKFNEDKSSSYVIGYKVFYQLQYDKLSDADKAEIESKRKHNDEQRKIVKQFITIKPRVVGDKSVSIEITEENVEDCARGYETGLRAARRGQHRAEGQVGHREEKSEIYRMCYDIGHRDGQNERDTDETAAIVRECALGFQAARSRVRKGGKPFNEKLIEGKSRSYIISYKVGYQFYRDQELKRKKKPRLESEVIEVMPLDELEEPETEGIIAEEIPEEGVLQNFSFFRSLREGQEELLFLIQDEIQVDDAPSSDGHPVIEITDEIAKDCVAGYRQGRLIAKHGGMLKWLESKKNTPEIYRIAFKIGYLDELARESREIDLNLTAIKIRDCVAGFDWGIKNARNGLPPRQEFEGKSLSYIAGYNGGYSYKLDKMHEEQKVELKRKYLDDQEDQRLPKKPRLEEPESVILRAQHFFGLKLATECSDLQTDTIHLLPVPGRD